MSEPIVFLPLSQGKVAIIDFADFEKVGRFKWAAQKTLSGNFYVVRTVWEKTVLGRINPKTLYLQCEILGIKGVDHKSGDGLDNRRENLRPATVKENGQASRRKPIRFSSRFRGVHWFKRDSIWRAQISTAGVTFYLGRFKLEEDAARAYDKKAIELGFFKEALNFPNEIC